ncbi:hypothetical protein BC567DRAFT_222030 [Phyllosticta citribraziliensis]
MKRSTRDYLSCVVPVVSPGRRAAVQCLWLARRFFSYISLPESHRLFRPGQTDSDRQIALPLLWTAGLLAFSNHDAPFLGSSAEAQPTPPRSTPRAPRAPPASTSTASFAPLALPLARALLVPPPLAPPAPASPTPASSASTPSGPPKQQQQPSSPALRPAAPPQAPLVSTGASTGSRRRRTAGRPKNSHVCCALRAACSGGASQQRRLGGRAVDTSGWN